MITLRLLRSYEGFILEKGGMFSRKIHREIMNKQLLWNKQGRIFSKWFFNLKKLSFLYIYFAILTKCYNRLTIDFI